MANRLPLGLELMVQRLMSTPGYTIRQGMRESGVSKQTITRIRSAMKLPSCPCGASAGHRGWCSFRFKNSPSRQAFMVRVHQSASRAAIVRHNQSRWTLGVHVEGSRSIKDVWCFVKGCPYPVIGTYRDINGDVNVCYQHAEFLNEEKGLFDAPLRASFLEHTGSALDRHDLFATEKVRRPALRIATKWEMENYERIR